MRIRQSGIQAIVTKILPPTGSAGTRVKASCAAGSIIVPYDHSRDDEGNHNEACRLLLGTLKWDAHEKARTGGMLLDGRYVFVVSE